MNRLTLIGIVNHSPVYHCTSSGQDLTRFTLQTAQSRGAEAIHYCLSWGPAALDLHEHLQPGDRLMIEGVLQYRWKKGPSGKKLRVAEIVVKGYTYLGRGDLVQFSRKEHLVR